jgi:hypothetical protein
MNRASAATRRVEGLVNVVAQSRQRLVALLFALFALTAALAAGGTRSALAFTASGQLTPDANGNGSGFTTTISGTAPSVQVSIRGATPDATYAIYSCLPLTGGDFDCVGRNNPPALQMQVLALRALAPITVGLVQQGSITLDSSGAGATTIGLVPGLLPDTPHSIFNVVHLANAANPSDAYTALNLQTPLRPVAGVTTIAPLAVTTVIGVPVFVLAVFPGYAYPVAITAVPGAPFVPFIFVPSNLIGFSPFSATVGLCANGRPPVVHLPPFSTEELLSGQIVLQCVF